MLLHHGSSPSEQAAAPKTSNWSHQQGGGRFACEMAREQTGPSILEEIDLHSSQSNRPRHEGIVRIKHLTFIRPPSKSSAGRPTSCPRRGRVEAKRLIQGASPCGRSRHPALTSISVHLSLIDVPWDSRGATSIRGLSSNAQTTVEGEVVPGKEGGTPAKSDPLKGPVGSAYRGDDRRLLTVTRAMRYSIGPHCVALSWKAMTRQRSLASSDMVGVCGMAPQWIDGQRGTPSRTRTRPASG